MKACWCALRSKECAAWSVCPGAAIVGRLDAGAALGGQYGAGQTYVPRTMHTPQSYSARLIGKGVLLHILTNHLVAR